MDISKVKNGSDLMVTLSGRLDTMTAPELEAALEDDMDGVEDLTFDFDGIEYISSAGLRVLLAAQKTMNRQGEMKLINVRDVVMDVFDMTGFSDILNIE